MGRGGGRGGKMLRVLITGGSRGVGASVAKRFARQRPGSMIAILGRSWRVPSHPGLEGTLDDVSKEIHEMGCTPLPIRVDMRNASDLEEGIRRAIRSFGGLDVLVNNASAFALGGKTKEMDLVHEVNCRGTMISIRECKPELEKSKGCIVTISPPIRLSRLEWVSSHPPYTISKYGMTLSTLAAASETVRANCLWPKRTLSTASTKMMEERGILEGAYKRGRDPDYFARCVFKLATQSSSNASTLLDEDLIRHQDASSPLDAFVEEDGGGKGMF